MIVNTPHNISHQYHSKREHANLIKFKGTAIDLNEDPECLNQDLQVSVLIDHLGQKIYVFIYLSRLVEKRIARDAVIIINKRQTL